MTEKIRADRVEETRRRFLRHVTNHQLTVAHEDGLYRHLRFRDPKSSFYWFDLITWPGNLAIRSDMGDFLFSRSRDMFDFFGGGWGVDPGYWAEKVTAGEPRKYAVGLLYQHLVEVLEDYAEDGNPDRRFEAQLEFWRRIEADVLDDFYGTEHSEEAARDALRELDEHSASVIGETWEWELRDFSVQYLWCCFAIRWGIEAYDRSRLDLTSTPESEATRA